VTPHDGTRLAPSLERIERDGLVLYTDVALRESDGIVVAFSERTGGVSKPPYASLNLAAHVGDDPLAVDANRVRLLDALGCAGFADRVVTAQQVHGSVIAHAQPSDAGTGARASAGTPPFSATDAIITHVPDTPLLMMYADCVPVILVARKRVPMVAVVHAGWKGTLELLSGRTAVLLAAKAGCETSDLLAYIGPHIGGCCYEVDEPLRARFRACFVSEIGHGTRLDLGAAVNESLTAAGVEDSCISGVGVCTQHHPARFFSYRAAETTGRHGALAILNQG